MSKIGQYIVDNDIDVCGHYHATLGAEDWSPYETDDFEWTEGDKMWDSVQEWKDLFKDDPVLF